MIVKQLSIFIENREGRLAQVTETLKEQGININTLSLADTSEYGMLRLIVSDADKGREVLKEAGFSAKLTEVVGVKMEDRVGFLSTLLKDIGSENFSIEYMYTLPTKATPYIILKVANPVQVEALLASKGYK